MAKLPPERPPSPTPLRTMLELVRAPAIFTAISNILAAHLIATEAAVQWRVLVLTAGASAFLYAAGMVLNDCFDLPRDARERPQRPLPSGRVSLQAAWASGWFLLGGGIALAAVAGPTQLSVAGFLALAIVLYDGVLKNTVLATLSMGACRYLNWLFGLSVAGLSAESLLIALPVLIYVVSLTALASVEATAASRLPLSRCAAGMLLTALSVAGLVASEILPNRWVLVPLTLALVAVLRELSVTSRAFSPASVQAMVKLLILGIIPLDAMLAFAGGAGWGALAVLALMLPGHFLARAIRIT